MVNNFLRAKSLLKICQRIAFASILGLVSPITLAQTDIIEFKSVEQEQLYRELTAELRCPKCQNQNIADSNAVVVDIYALELLSTRELVRIRGVAFSFTHTYNSCYRYGATYVCTFFYIS